MKRYVERKGAGDLVRKLNGFIYTALRILERKLTSRLAPNSMRRSTLITNSGRCYRPFERTAESLVSLAFATVTLECRKEGGEYPPPPHERTTRSNVARSFVVALSLNDLDSTLNSKFSPAIFNFTYGSLGSSSRFISSTLHCGIPHCRFSAALSTPLVFPSSPTHFYFTLSYKKGEFESYIFLCKENLY